MHKLYPGISPTAASRMERIAGSYARMSNLEQLSFTQNLREARRKGTRAKSIKGKVESDVQEETPIADRQEAERDAGSTGSSDSESSEHKESENAGG